MSHNRELGIFQRFEDFVKSPKAKGLAAASLLALGVAGAEAQETPPPQETVDPNVRYETVVTGANGANLRSEPSASARRIQGVSTGTRLEVSRTGIITNDGNEWLLVWEINDVPVEEGTTMYVARVVLGDLDEVESEDAPAVAAPVAPVEISNVNATEAPQSTGVFAVPQEATPQLENYTADRTPEAITTSEDWTFDAQSMSYVNVTPEGEVRHYRWYMGNTQEEDLEFGSQFVERDALEYLDESGNILFRMSIETSNLDPNLESITYNPDIPELYGLSESEFTHQVRDILYRNYPFLEEEGINDVRFVYRSGVTYTNSGNDSDRGDTTRGNVSEDRGFDNIFLNANSNTLIIYLGIDSSITANNLSERFYTMPLTYPLMSLFVRQLESEGRSIAGVDQAAPMREVLGEILTINGNEQYADLGDNADNIIQVQFRE